MFLGELAIYQIYPNCRNMPKKKSVQWFTQRKPIRRSLLFHKVSLLVLCVSKKPNFIFLPISVFCRLSCCTLAGLISSLQLACRARSFWSSRTYMLLWCHSHFPEWVTKQVCVHTPDIAPSNEIVACCWVSSRRNRITSLWDVLSPTLITQNNIFIIIAFFVINILLSYQISTVDIFFDNSMYLSLLQQYKIARK